MSSNLCQVYAPNESPSIIFGPLVQWLSFQRRRRTLKIMAFLLSIISNRLHIIINMCSHLRRVSIFWVNCIFLTERDMSVSKFFVHLTKRGITINEFCVSAKRTDIAENVGSFAGLKHNDCLQLSALDNKQCSNLSSSKILVHALPRHSHFLFIFYACGISLFATKLSSLVG